MRLAISEQRWNCLAHFRYRGSIEYRETSDCIVIVVRISGIAQHYQEAEYQRRSDMAYRSVPNVKFKIIVIAAAG